jgi:hypothetical protein
MTGMSRDQIPEELLTAPMEPALQELGESPSVPAFAIALCTFRYADVAEVFRKVLEMAASGTNLDGNEALLFFRGLHIIGYSRDPQAFEPLLRFLRRPRDEVEGLLGDATTETLPQIIAGVFDGDVDGLLDAALDLSIEESVRDALIGAAAFLTWEGRVPREQFVAFLQRFHDERLAPDGDMAWFGWTKAVGLLGLRDMQPAVLAAMERGVLPKEWWEPELFEEDLAAAEQTPEDITRFNESCLGYIDDLVAALERFDTGDENEFQSPALILLPPDQDNAPVTNPWRTVGRNDPCPCGSGKKAKRCCLAA